MFEQNRQKSEMDWDLSEIPIRALSLSTRHQLSERLNGEQYITTSEGLSRDYRGLAQLMGFSYAIMNSIVRTTDPLNGLIQMYENRSEATFGRLLQMIEQIERFDVIDDMIPIILKDGKHYLKDIQSKRQSSVQSPDINSNRDLIPIYDPIVTYDAYVCYSDKDFGFVQQLSRFLESPEIGLRLFIRDRDLCLGSWAYESFAQVIDTQCKKVLIIFSPDFLECPECDFQAKFATGLAIEHRDRKLIPIIYRSCILPPIIRMLTKIDMTRCSDTTDWSWKRLVNSISNHVVANRRTSSGTDKPTLLQLPSNSSNSSNESQLNSIETIDETMISFPSVCPTPTAPPLISTQSSVCSSINSEISDKSESSEFVPILSTDKDKNPKKINHKKWIQTFRQKFKS